MPKPVIITSVTDASEKRYWGIQHDRTFSQIQDGMFGSHESDRRAAEIPLTNRVNVSHKTIEKKSCMCYGKKVYEDASSQLF